jgi:hypothetical protein
MTSVFAHRGHFNFLSLSVALQFSEDSAGGALVVLSSSTSTAKFVGGEIFVIVQTA